MATILPSQLIKLREVTLERSAGVSADAWITGICCMPNGEVIMADNNNSRVLVYTMRYVYRNSTQLSGSPWDVSSIDESHFVASIAETSSSNQLHVFELSNPKSSAISGNSERYDMAISPRSSDCELSSTATSKPEIRIHHTIRLPFTCHGVVYVNNALVVTCVADTSVKLLDMHGNVKWSVRSLPFTSRPFFKCPLYVSARLDGLTFVVTDAKNHSITVLSYKGEILNSKTVRNSHPLGVTVSYTGNIYVCLKGNNSVIETTDALIKEKVRGLHERGVNFPQAILYHPKTDQFLMSSTHNSKLDIFELM